MPQIQWAINSYQARALPLSAQRIVNFYAEQAPKDAKSPVVLFNTPGIKLFCEPVGDGPIRGMELMDGILYVISGDVLYSVTADCVITALGSIGVGADSTSTTITGAKVPASASFEITDGSSGTISSITVGGEELLAGAVPWATSNPATALAIITPGIASVAPSTGATSSTNSDPEGSYSSVTVLIPVGTAEGHLLFAQIGRTDGALDAFQDGTITPLEAGWIPIVENMFSKSDTGSATCLSVGCVMSLYWRIATASEPADYTWNYDTVNSPHAIGAITLITGHNPTAPVQAVVESTISLCGQFNRAFTIEPTVSTTAKTMTIVALAEGERLMSTGSPFGFDWSKITDEFKGPISTSLQLQALVQNDNLPVGEQWTAGDLSHADLVNPPTGNLNLMSIVCAALSIAPEATGIKDDTGGYIVTVDSATVTITAADGTGAELNGLPVVITVTGDVTVDTGEELPTSTTLTDGITMPAIIETTGGGGIPLKSPDCVSMSHNDATLPQLIIVDGTNGWIFDTTNGLQQITDPDFFSADVVDFQDQFFVLNRAGTGQFFLSNLNNGLAYLGTDIATAEGDPDNLVALISNRRELWLFGTETIEIWYNSGNADFPFSRFEGGFLERGLAAAFSIAEDDNSLFWLAEDRIFYRADSATQQLRISQHGIEEALRKYAVISDACAFIYTMEGHKFYVCTFPSVLNPDRQPGVTWVYDITTELWHERSSVGMGRWRVNVYADAYGKHLVGDFDRGRIGELDLDTFTEYGEVMQGQATGPVVYADRKRIFHHRFELDVDAGHGLTSGQGSDPQVWLDYSDDGGHTWSERKPFFAIGKIGAYLNRLRWLRLGQSRQRIYRLTVSDPVKRSIVAAHLDAEAGDH